MMDNNNKRISELEAALDANSTATKEAIALKDFKKVVELLELTRALTKELTDLQLDNMTATRKQQQTVKLEFPKIY